MAVIRIWPWVYSRLPTSGRVSIWTPRWPVGTRAQGKPIHSTRQYNRKAAPPSQTTSYGIRGGSRTYLTKYRNRHAPSAPILHPQSVTGSVDGDLGAPRCRTRRPSGHIIKPLASPYLLLLLIQRSPLALLLQLLEDLHKWLESFIYDKK